MRDIGKEMREELDFFKQFTKPKTKTLVEFKQNVAGKVEFEDYTDNKEVPNFWQASYEGRVNNENIELNFVSFFENSHEIKSNNVPARISKELEKLAMGDAGIRAKQEKDWIKKGEEAKTEDNCSMNKNILNESKDLVKEVKIKSTDEYLPSYYEIKAREQSEDEYKKKAFIINNMRQVSKKGNYIVIKNSEDNDELFLPDEVYKELVKLISNKSKFYLTNIGTKILPTSQYSYGQWVSIKGGTLK